MRVEDEISPEHPALPGHFPGRPIVPGALLLARVCRAVTAAYGCPVKAVPAAKFLAPLRPAERFEIRLERAGNDVVRFRVVRGETAIAGGSVCLSIAPKE